MFHIVFNVNEEYVKYLAVLCHSIIKSTPRDSPLRSGGGGKIPYNDPLKEGYCFHILTDGMSDELRAIYEVNCQSIRSAKKS